jgi:hypothetical protein
MSNRAATITTGFGVNSGYSVPQSDQVDFQNRYLQFAARWAYQNTMPMTVKLEPPYQLNISPYTPWLAAVERRIEKSIVPKEYESLGSGEWLREEVGQSAIRFFQNTADILPGEPFIYASQTGALVAEFTAPTGALTTVVSPTSIILFAAKADELNAPVQRTVKRGSNRLREDLKEIVQTLAGSHGQMGPTR